MREIVSFKVLGFDPVPWSVPNIGTGTSKKGKRFRFTTRRKKSDPFGMSPSFEDWQKLIKSEATKAMGAKDDIFLHLGPVKLRAMFYKQTPPEHRHGEVWYAGVKRNEENDKWVKSGNHEPDLTNLVKAIEDAMEGVVYANDVQVRSHEIEMHYHTTPGVAIQVYELDSEDNPGYGDPVQVPEKPKRKRRCKTETTSPSSSPSGDPPPSPSSRRKSRKRPASTTE